jgi:hypothetical protein
VICTKSQGSALDLDYAMIWRERCVQHQCSRQLDHGHMLPTIHGVAPLYQVAQAYTKLSTLSKDPWCPGETTWQVAAGRYVYMEYETEHDESCSQAPEDQIKSDQISGEYTDSDMCIDVIDDRSRCDCLRHPRATFRPQEVLNRDVALISRARP